MKMQIAFRETTESRGKYAIAIACGVFETSPQDQLAYDETMMRFSLMFSPDGVPHGATSSREPARITDGYADYTPKLLDISTLSDLLTTTLRRMEPNSLVNAEFAMRRTDVAPSEHGAEVHAFIGTVYVGPGEKLDTSKIFQLGDRGGWGERHLFLEGTLGDDFRPELGELDFAAATRGMTTEGIMQQPWWGFGDEPVSLPGTLRASNYEQADRFHEIHFLKPELKVGKEYAYLVERMKYLGLGKVLENPQLEKYVAERYADASIPSAFKPVPLSRHFSRKAAVETLVKSVLFPTNPL